MEDEAAGRGDRTGGGTQERVGPHEVCSARGSDAETVGLLAVHDLMSEAEVSSMVIGHTSCRVLLFTVLMDVNEGIMMLFTGVEEVQLHDQHDVANNHFKCRADGDVIHAGIEGFRGKWNGTRRLRLAAMTGEKDE